jgi:Protein kinase domain
MSRATSSNSSASRTEVVAGSVIAGFRVERLLGRGSLGAVYEATQLSLGRTVALRLLDERDLADPGLSARFQEQQRLAASVHHPNLMPTYEAGEWSEGRFVAARYVRGRPLAALLEEGSLPPDRARAMLEPIAAALDTAHAAGLVHGRVTARNVLVDSGGTAYLADLGLGRSGSAAADREALAALRARAERGKARRRRRSLILGGLAGLAVAAAVVALVADGGDDTDADTEPAPPIAAGTAPFGSELAPGPARGDGCGPRPGPNTPACTISQSTLAGRSIVVPQDGVIRRWAVRGAAGELSLQVLRGQGRQAFLAGFSQVERVRDRGPQVFESDVQVERGDRLGVLLAPGSVIGTRAPTDDAAALRWEGALDLRPRGQSFQRLDRELLFRADIEAGARADLPPQLSGGRAAGAPDGRLLGHVVIALSQARAVEVRLVRLRGRIALDAFRGRGRLARVAVPDADPGGRLLNLTAGCGYGKGFCLRWLNEGERLPLVHVYTFARRGTAVRLIG